MVTDACRASGGKVWAGSLKVTAIRGRELTVRRVQGDALALGRGVSDRVAETGTIADDELNA